MELIDVIFCDDIRQEINNKVSLMGLYTDRIIIHGSNSGAIKWPVAVNLSTLLRFNIEDSEKKIVQFMFEYLLNDKSIFKVEGDINLENCHKIMHLVLVGNIIQAELGNLGFSVRIYDSKKEYLKEVEKTFLTITN